MILGDFRTNCYIIDNNGNAIIVDPGDNGKKINKYLINHSLDLKAILITHGHIDHIGAINYLYSIFHCDIYCHHDTIELAKNSKYNLSFQFGEPYILNSPLIEVKDLDILNLIGYNFRWYYTPGHCQGSSMIYFIEENIMFSGDMLFKGSIGRYDFPTSSHYEMKCSVERIKLFDFNFRIYPGHGDFSTFEYEKNNNPYLK